MAYVKPAYPAFYPSLGSYPYYTVTYEIMVVVQVIGDLTNFEAAFQSFEP